MPIYTQEYERWFRDVGQFLEPAGDLKDAGKLELLKAWGQSVHTWGNPELDAAKEESLSAEKAKEKAEAALDDLKIEITNLITNWRDEAQLNQLTDRIKEMAQV